MYFDVFADTFWKVNFHSMNIIILYVVWRRDDDVNVNTRKVIITKSVTVSPKFCNLPKYILLQRILFAA